jgi:acetolactate synthase-1/2/3 large subunit
MYQTAAAALVAVLLAQRVERAFCVPGESYLPVLDELRKVCERIEVITCRHEAAASHMAEAHGKLTGQPGICFVTRGPGATHASIGVHTARQDSTPMILFVGQVSRDQRDREAFQEIDYRQMFGGIAKWVAEVDDPARLPEYVHRAFAVSLQGRPGPVVLALPEDILELPVTALGADLVRPALNAPAPHDLATLQRLLAAAERPVLLLGGSGWNAEALDTLRLFVEAHDLPVVTSFRRKDLFDNEHPNYAGELGFAADPRLIERMRSSDLVISLGARLGEVATGGYSLFKAGVSVPTLVHVHPDPEEIGRVYRPLLGVVASLVPTAAALAKLKSDRTRSAWREEARADYLRYAAPLRLPEKMDLSQVFAELAELLPPDAIVTNGAGNYAGWLHRFYTHRRFRTQLAPTSGAMGYGLPAAIAAKLAHPERHVVAVAGDGCFLMSSQELATAALHRLGLIVLIVNNDSYGTIRMHQERAFPGHTIGTDLCNPDFVHLAEAYGASAIRISRTDQFAPAIKTALGSTKSTVIELVCDLERLAPHTTITELRTVAAHRTVN